MFQSFSRQDKSCVGGFHPSFKERGFSASHPYNKEIFVGSTANCRIIKHD
jgi:hypothetical protein